ncbi:unnamed protein product [Symbiodinium pilosum]|uniref:Biotin-protein ligase N-terminal domain-containing protein n=1 Tax=Symbiodinium pilosum TaxID=2952 RepID=A0A812XZ05_SYMPI|nr:unnamed protein product [Symbiodinium pilosum]
MTVGEFCDSASLLGKCLVVIHGGTEQGNYIRELERAVLIKHLEHGGSIMTIASGSTFCGCNKGCLSLLPIFAHDRRHWSRGTGDIQMALSACGAMCLPRLPDLQGEEAFQSKYFNGPAIVPMSAEEYRDMGGAFDLECGMGVTFLTYQTEMNECEAETPLLGMPSVIVGQMKPSRARFVAISPNVEVSTSPPTRALIQELVSWASMGSRHMQEASIFFQEMELPNFDDHSVTGTLGDGGLLVQLFKEAGRDLEPLCLPRSLRGDGFALPEGRRLVILDLGKGREQLEDIFQPLVPDPEQRPIIEPQALQDCLRREDVVLLHGGMANEHAERLGVGGRAALRQHLQNGGSLLGICAGAHWLSCRDLPLWGHILPAVPHDNANWRRGVGDVTVRLTSEGQRILDLPDLPTLGLRYANGPLLVALLPEVYVNYQPGRVPEAMEGHEDVVLHSDSLPTPLAVFSDCCDQRVEGWQAMKGHAAAWAWQASSGGRVVSVSPHPEYAQSEESRLLFRRFLLWCLST